MSTLLAFDNVEEFDKFLTGLGKNNFISYFILGCKLDYGNPNKVMLPCKENLPILKKAPLKVKMAR